MSIDADGWNINILLISVTYMETSARNTIASPIFTDRLQLTPISINDIDEVIRLRTDPRIFYWRTVDTKEQAEKWLRDRLTDPRCLNYRIDLKENAKTDGQIQAVGLLGAPRLPEVGYIIDPAHWGQGYATEALRGYMENYWRLYPAGHPSLESTAEGLFLKAETGPEAAASRKVLQKCGFVFNGKREEEEEGRFVLLDCWICRRPR